VQEAAALSLDSALTQREAVVRTLQVDILKAQRQLEEESDKREEVELQAAAAAERHAAKLTELELVWRVECQEKDARAAEAEQELVVQRMQGAELRVEVVGLTRELDGVQRRLVETQSRCVTLEGAEAGREKALATMQRRTGQLEEQRRAMHNVMQTLRGNVRVVCRVRPLLPAESTALINSRAAFSTSGPFEFPARKPWEGNRYNIYATHYK
jgi:kinesin family protein C1